MLFLFNELGIYLEQIMTLNLIIRNFIANVLGGSFQNQSWPLFHGFTHQYVNLLYYLNNLHYILLLNLKGIKLVLVLSRNISKFWSKKQIKRSALLQIKISIELCSFVLVQQCTGKMFSGIITLKSWYRPARAPNYTASLVFYCDSTQQFSTNYCHFTVGKI